MSEASQTHQQLQDKKRIKNLYQMTWPMLIGVLSLMSYQLVDSFYISLLGTEPLAVIGFTIPMYQMIIGFQVGIGIATTALISQLIGANNHHGANTLSSQILFIGSVLILFICSLIWFFRDAILNALGATSNLDNLVDQFWSVWLISAFIGAFAYFGYSICRAHGNTRLPGICMVLTSVMNIALDPLFIFYFDMGLAGAAYASSTSFLVGCCIAFPIIFKNNWLSTDQIFSTLSRAISRISTIAAPAILSQLLPAAASSIATGIVAAYGLEAVAAWGLGIRVEFFSIVLILALTMSLPPMIGKEYGAKNFEEIKQLMRVAVKNILIIQTAIGILFILFSSPLSALLTKDELVANYLQNYLIFIPISYGALGVCMLMVSASNAVSQPLQALFISFNRLFICYLPFLWVGAQSFGFNGLVVGALIGNICAGFTAWLLFNKNAHKWH